MRKNTFTTAAVVRVSRLDYWPTAATSFLVALALGVVMVVMSAVLWFALTEIGILQQIDARITAVAGEGAFQLEDVLTLSKMVGVTTIIAALLVGLAPLAGLIVAGVYNGAARLTGGLSLRLTSAAPALDEAPASEPLDSLDEPA